MNVNTHIIVRHTSFGVALALVALAIVMLAQVHVAGRGFAEARSPKKVDVMPPVDIGLIIEKRQAMLERKLHVSFVAEAGGMPISMFDLALKDHPLWITFDVRDQRGAVIISAERVKQHLISFPPQGIPSPQSCILLSSWTDDEGVLRAQTDCIAKSGYIYDQNVLTMLIKEALEKGEEKVEYVLSFVPAVVTDPTSGSDMPMKLLSTGHSAFEGSGLSRKANVRKALNEHVNNVLVPAGEIFSFNDTLGTVSVSKGWYMALTIFEGANLRPAPGGGICQASTTTYRAALAAGLPIIKYKNHSLYVTYYEKFGVGQDVTIFPGKQDFTFLNDTGAPLLIQAYNEGDEAYVQIFGADDHRTVQVSGPYFGKTAPKDLLTNGKILKNNEIGWVRTVTAENSEPKREVFVSRYKAIPKSLSSRWELTTVMTRGTVTPTIVAADH